MKKRIVLLSFIITAVALVLLSVISAEIYYQSGIAHSQQYLRAYVAAFDAERVPDELTRDYAKQLSEALQGARVSFLDGEGNLLADSSGEEGGSRADRPEIIKAIAEGEGFAVRHSDTVDENFVYYCKAFDGYLVRIAISADSQFGVYAQAFPTVLSVLAVALLFSILVAFLSTGVVLRPMETLIREAAQKKELQTSCSELKPLAALLNRMNEDAAERVKQINEEKNLVLKAQKSKNDFIANITHEMNTPLTSIKGFAELLASGALGEEQSKRAAQTILTQSERLTNLVACVINYNEIDNEDLPLYEVNASKIARETVEGLLPAIQERSITLKTSVAESVVLLSRYERVSEIFGNLIRNAIRYNKDGGTLFIALDESRFVVADTGIGIAEENLNRIFERFFTVDKSHGGKNGGFGLGLAVVKKLCAKAGWKLSVQSKLGEGTTFTVQFSQE